MNLYVVSIPLKYVLCVVGRIRGVREELDAGLPPLHRQRLPLPLPLPLPLRLPLPLPLRLPLPLPLRLPLPLQRINRGLECDAVRVFQGGQGIDPRGMAYVPKGCRVPRKHSSFTGFRYSVKPPSFS